MIPQRWYWLGVISSCLLLAIAYFYFEKNLGLAACPLCMFQRVCLAGVGLLCMLGIIFRPNKIGAKFLSFFASLFSLAGLAIAGRQVWLQHLPKDKVPECGPDLAFMLDYFPLTEVITTVLSGSGECAEVQWQWIGLSIPEWMVVVFSIMLLLCLKLLFKKERRMFN